MKESQVVNIYGILHTSTYWVLIMCLYLLFAMHSFLIIDHVSQCPPGYIYIGHRFYIKTKLNIAETAQMLPQNNPLTGLNVDSGTNILVTTCTKDASDLTHTSTSDVVYK